MEFLDLMMADNHAEPTLPVALAYSIDPQPASAAADGEAALSAGPAEPEGAAEPSGDPAQTQASPPPEMAPEMATFTVAPAAVVAPAHSDGTGEGTLYEHKPVATRLMHALARRATEAETEAEAVAVVGALVPLAIRQAVRDETNLWTAAPGMLRAAAEATQSFYHAPAYRPLLTSLPGVLVQAAAMLDLAAAKGRRLSPRLGYLAVTRGAASAVTEAEAGWLENAAWEAVGPAVWPAASAVRMYQVFVE